MWRIVSLCCFLSLALSNASAQTNFFKNPGAKNSEGWNRFAGGEGVVAKFDSKVGCAKKGSLYISYVGGSKKTPWQWRQVCDVSKAKTKRFYLGAKVKGQGLACRRPFALLLNAGTLKENKSSSSTTAQTSLSRIGKT